MRESLHNIQKEAGGKHSLNTVWLLALAMACSTSIGATIATMGPLSAKSLGASASVSTFTVGAVVVGTSVAALFAGSVFATFGRRIGFLLASSFFIIGALLGILALHERIPWMEIFACFITGIGIGLANFLRFAAVESTLPSFRARAITFVLLGGVAAAVLGPLGGDASITMVPGKPFVGCYIVILIFSIICLVLVLCVDFNTKTFLQDPAPKTSTTRMSQQSSPAARSPHARSSFSMGNALGLRMSGESSDLQVNINAQPVENYHTVITSPTFIAAVGISSFAQIIMTVLMSTVTLAMNGIFSYKESTASYVIMLHILGMFLPGFWTGSLIDRFGVVYVTGVGMLFNAAAIAIMLVTHELPGFITAMIFVGIGWNLGYTCGSVLLLGAYREGSKLAPLVQSRHDFIVLFLAGVGSLGGGLVFQQYQWTGVLVLAIILVGFQACASLFAWHLRHKYLSEKIETVRASFSGEVGGGGAEGPALNALGEVSMHDVPPNRWNSSSPVEVPSAEDGWSDDSIFVGVPSTGMRSLRDSIDGGSWVASPSAGAPASDEMSAENVTYVSRASSTIEKEINEMRSASVDGKRGSMQAEGLSLTGLTAAGDGGGGGGEDFIRSPLFSASSPSPRNTLTRNLSSG